MLKRIFYLVLIGSVFFACEQQEEKESRSRTRHDSHKTEQNAREKIAPNVRIEGFVELGGNQTLILEQGKGQNFEEIARTQTDQDGNFSFEVGIAEIGLYQLRIDGAYEFQRRPKAIPLTLEPGDHVKLGLTYEEFSNYAQYEGTSWAEPLNGYFKKMQKFIDWQKSIPDPRAYSNEVLREMINEHKAPVEEYIANQLTEDPSNPANIYLMNNLLPNFGLDNYEESNVAVLKKMVDGFLEKYPDKKVTTELEDRVMKLEKEVKDYHDFVVKSIAPEIELPNPKGETMKLSSLRGNYVLIDFWASWCMPCRQENPNVVRLYDKYENENFDIFSVSLDKNKAKWIEAIEHDGLRWKNHVSDLLHWKTPLTGIYHFNAIPHTVLIDPEGKIIAQNLRGQALENKLQEIFGK